MSDNQQAPQQPEFTLDPVIGKGTKCMEVIGATKSALWMVPIGEIHVLENFNVRVRNAEYEEHVETLAGLILENGFSQDKPLSGIAINEDGRDVAYIYDGHRRLEATRRAIERGAQIDKLPVVMAPPGTNIEDITAALVTRNSGKPLTPYETGIVCKRLVGYGWDNQTIAKKLSMTPVYVGQLLQIVGAPATVRDMIKEGEVSVSVALEAMRTHGSKVVEKLQQAKGAAAATGKRKVTMQHLPGKRFEKLVKQSAPKLYEAACRVVKDPGFSGLELEAQEFMRNLVKELASAQLELPDANPPANVAATSDAAAAEASTSAGTASDVPAAQEAQPEDAGQQAAEAGADPISLASTELEPVSAAGDVEEGVIRSSEGAQDDPGIEFTGSDDQTSNIFHFGERAEMRESAVE